ncbi:39S ribosomal protein L36 [Trichonephila clavata]|uniref:Large ribosomal subunit protein bL36m n=1 Tax=Trichonephila clavata TaxID=2740835 RepID=A0A8X6L6C6_TRICU|nr:39S ribosomal protein L36 [Trichonephila clavata]
MQQFKLLRGVFSLTLQSRRGFSAAQNFLSSPYFKQWNQVCFPSPLPYLIQFRGFKDKDVLTKRCKDCYFQRIDGRWFVFCKTHPRHKQRQRIDEKSKWIITHSTHGVKKF